MDCLDRIIDNVLKSSEEDYFDLNLDDEPLWLESLMDVPLLNDCALTSDFSSCVQPTDDYSSQPIMDSEHSYSQANLSHSFTEAYVSNAIYEQELDSAMMTAVDPNLAMTPDLYSNTSEADHENVSEMCEEEVVMSSHDHDVSSSPVSYVENEPVNSGERLENTMQEQTYTLSVDHRNSTTDNTVISPSVVLTYQPATRIIKRPTIIVTKNIQSFNGNGVVARNRLTGFVHAAERTASCRVVKVLGGGQTGKQVSIIRTQHVPDDIRTASHELQNDDDANLPPSPPSSDGEGLSPKRYTVSSTTQVWTPRSREVVSLLATPTRSHISPTGRLILTEEERRTLIAEGYPVPTRLPLTKQDENNLKKIQRKIKNKMSAQESRRKKKDYLDLLEKKLEISNQENNQLKKQLESLQSDNRTLQSQINKLHSLANKLKPSVETSTCVMVLALFFAMFASTFWIPASLTAGRIVTPWSITGDNAAAALSSGPIAVADDYRTPNIKSRTLMSMVEEPSDDLFYKKKCRGSILDWLTKFTCSQNMAIDCTYEIINDNDNDDCSGTCSSGEVHPTPPIDNQPVVTGRQELYIAVENGNVSALINATADVVVLTNSRVLVNGTYVNEIRTLPV